MIAGIVMSIVIGISSVLNPMDIDTTNQKALFSNVVVQ